MPKFNLSELLDQIEAKLDEREEKIEVGQVSEELAEKFIVKNRNRMVLDARIAARAHELETEATKRIKQEFGEEMAENDKLHDELWSEVYQELGIKDKKANYTLNAETGRVYIKGSNRAKATPINDKKLN